MAARGAYLWHQACVKVCACMPMRCHVSMYMHGDPRALESSKCVWQCAGVWLWGIPACVAYSGTVANSGIKES